MNRARTDERKVSSYRTVTEIVDSDNVYQKEFDVSDLVYQNEAYIRKMSKHEMYVNVAKYYAMVRHQHNIPDLRLLLGSNNQQEKLFTLVYYSLAFVNSQMVPHNVEFVDMQFIEVKDRKSAIPTEPIVFYKSDDEQNEIIKCFVDRPGLLRILEKPIDVTTEFENSDDKQDWLKMVDKIKNVERKKNNQRFCVNKEYNDLPAGTNLEEPYMTQFVTLLIIFCNAYLGLFKLMRSDFTQYFAYLLNHENLIKDNSLSNLKNLLIGQFSFKVTTDTEKKSTGTLTFRNS
uniref:Occlusion derived virus envelope and capsid protein 27 n=1 Tax=Phthorimaea operculella granulovirus TaxID=192584 RepID=A0A1B2CS60_9BBAC|nr:occlusion derived virus envelope and capsid protein 27 [Phthorimaea operculella granulovirus]